MIFKLLLYKLIVTQAQTQESIHHHQHVISTTSTFPTTNVALTTNPFLLQQKPSSASIQYSMNNPFIHNPF